jgi:hypothetical protein
MGAMTSSSFRSSHKCAIAKIGSGRAARILAARMNSPRICIGNVRRETETQNDVERTV